MGICFLRVELQNVLLSIECIFIRFYHYKLEKYILLKIRFHFVQAKVLKLVL